MRVRVPALATYDNLNSHGRKNMSICVRCNNPAGGSWRLLGGVHAHLCAACMTAWEGHFDTSLVGLRFHALEIRKREADLRAYAGIESAVGDVRPILDAYREALQEARAMALAFVVPIHTNAAE